MIVNINVLQMRNHRYFSYDGIIKGIDLTIKCIDFKSFYYVINRANVSFYMVFSNFDFMFLWIYF